MMASVEISRITCLVTSLGVFLLIIANNGVRVTGQHVSLFSCNFEIGFCGMNQSSGDWTKYNAPPAKNTRPTSDHTTGPGSYVYTEINSTNSTSSATGRLRTPRLSLNMSQTLSSLRVVVHVSMYGYRYQMGNLSVFAVDANDTRTLLANWTDGTPAWKLREIETDILFWTNDSYVEFDGTLGNGGNISGVGNGGNISGVALDDLNITGIVNSTTTVPLSSNTPTSIVTSTTTLPLSSTTPAGIVTATTSVYVTSSTPHPSSVSPNASISIQSSTHAGSTTVPTSTSTSISTIQYNATTTSQSIIPSTTGRNSKTNTTKVYSTIPSRSISSGSVNTTPGSSVTTATSSQLVSTHTTNLTAASGSPIPPRMPIAANGSPIPLWLAIPALILSCIALIIAIAMVLWIVKKRSQVSDKAGPEPAQTDYYVGRPVTQTPALLSTWISYRPNLKLRPPQPKLEYFDNDEVVVNEKIQLENSFTA